MEKESGKADEFERQQEKQLAIIMFIYEAKNKDDKRTIFNTEAAKALKATEDSIIAHPDFAKWCRRDYANTTTETDYQCETVNLSPIKFLYASEFDDVKAAAVVAELKKPNVFNAYKKYGRCFDFPPLSGMTQKKREMTCDVGCISGACEILTADKEAARIVAADMTAIQKKWDGKGTDPVQNMAVLAEYVVWTKELPSRSMTVDFFLDKNFNTTNTENTFSRTMLGFGGPLRGFQNAAKNKNNRQKQTNSE